MKIVYYLITHKDQPQIERLIAHLLSSDNSLILIHHDAKSPRLTLPKSRKILQLDDPIPVNWGDITLTDAMWKGIVYLREYKIPFDWVIFLSGQDYPVKPIKSIETELFKTRADAFIHHELISENPKNHKRYMHTVCWRRYFRRPLTIAGMTLYLKRRHPYSPTFKCLAGSNWLNLSRKAVEQLWQGEKRLHTLRNYLRDTPCPEETVFQTLLLNGPPLNIENSDRRFILWQETGTNPETLTLEHLDEIRSSDAWFARKIDPTMSAALVDHLDETILSKA